MRFLLFSYFFFISACTIYSSSGRKDFEKNSPNYVRTQAFVGCEIVTENVNTPEFQDSFLKRSFHIDENFWVAEEKNIPYWIQVWKQNTNEICHYNYASLEEWQGNKAYFLEHLE